jgi:hypothetical protein
MCKSHKKYYEFGFVKKAMKKLNEKGVEYITLKLPSRKLLAVNRCDRYA